MRKSYLPLIAFMPLLACTPASDSQSGNQNNSESVAAVSTAKDITQVFFANRSANCADHIAAYKSLAKDLKSNQEYMGASTISVSGEKCQFATNAIPNHDFNDAPGKGFANKISEQNQRYEIISRPVAAASPTALSLQYDNAIMLNGVKVDLLAAGCFGVGDGKIGCNDLSQPWRYDPMSENTDFGADSHHAHTQPDGAYHYHGDPLALYPQDATQVSPVIGFAADGFPIFGPYIEVDGQIRRAKSSYQLKSGSRPIGNGSPGGNYDGTFIDDFSFVANSGDLDQCNGMTRDGVYGYYITESYPHVMGCFTGTPDPSFEKAGMGGPPSGGGNPPPGFPGR